MTLNQLSHDFVKLSYDIDRNSVSKDLSNYSRDFFVGKTDLVNSAGKNNHSI